MHKIVLTRCTRGNATRSNNNTVTIKPNLNSIFSGLSTCAYARKTMTKVVALPIKASISF